MSETLASRRRLTHTTVRRRETIAGYGMIAPALVGVAMFLLVPIVILVALSFASWDLLSPLEWVGLENWTKALGNAAMWHSFGVTTLFVLMVIPTQIAVGLWLATLLVRGIPGSAVVRTILVLPWVSAPLVLGIVWQWLLSYDGVVNHLLGQHIGWLTEPSLALPVTAFVQAWSQIGYVCLFFMAGLSSIPDEMVEAARVDGASERGIFWRIKLPMLRPTLFFVAVTGVISAFQTFDLVYSLTPNGGPQGATDLIAARIYNRVIESTDIGQAAVMALILFVILITITLLQNRYFARRTTYER